MLDFPKEAVEAAQKAIGTVHAPRIEQALQAAAPFIRKQRDKELRERLVVARRRLESQSFHMQDPAFAKTPVSALNEFRAALDSIFEEADDGDL